MKGKAMKDSHNPKKEMLQTFQTIWKHASEAERDYIENMWSKVMQKSHILNWESSGKTNEYQLELQQEVVGSHSEIPMGQLVLKKKIKIAFSEEKISGMNAYRHVISFLDKGVCFRIGIGWPSKDTPLERIMIEENQQHKIMCTVEAMGQSITRSGEEALAFWKKTHWNV